MSNRPSRIVWSVLAALCFLCESGAAVATNPACTGLGAATPYNALVFGSYSAQSSDVEGRIAAGGNLSINDYSIGEKLSAASAGVSVVVGGDFSFPSGRIYFGNAVVAGSAQGVGAPVRNGLAPGQSIVDNSTLPLNFLTEKQNLERLSAALAALPVNAAYRSEWGGLYLTGAANAAVQVFYLPGQLVLDAHTFDVTNIPAGATVVFNIRGAIAGLTDMSLESLAPLRRRVIFNFPDATALTLAGVSVEGSVLAPRAAISNPQGVIKGQLIAQSWNGMMQLNHEPFEGCLPTGAANQAPIIHSTPSLLATSGRAYLYDVDATDADQDAITYSLVSGPATATMTPGDGQLRWSPSASDLGLHPIVVRATDSNGAGSSQVYDLRVVQGFCALYPIALPQEALASVSPGAMVNQLPRGTGNGHFSWLTWSGANDAPTLANSLRTPGDSWRYVNPDNAADQVLNIADFARAAPGSMNASAVRERMDVLKTQDIILPVWDSKRGQGSNLAYRTLRFAKVRLTDYRLTGNGYISFEYKGDANCYNAAPIISDQSAATDEDRSVAIMLSGTDADGDTLSFAIVTAPAHGQLTGDMPNLIYTPAANYNGADVFTYRASDGSLLSANASVALTIAAVNDAPVAFGDTIVTSEEQAIATPLRASDVDADTLSFRVVQAPLHGTLTGGPPALTYTPAPDFSGDDYFSFRANDGSIDSNLASITVTVNAGNDAPVAIDQSLVTDEDGVFAFTLSATDADGGVLAFRVATQPEHGMLSGALPNLIYSPDADFHGEDRLTFFANDGSADSNLGTIAIVIRPVDDAPHAQSQSLTIAEDTTLPVVLTATDPDNDVLTFTIIQVPLHGTFSGSGSNLIYTPAQNYSGSDSFDFRVVDSANQTDTATITIAVTPVNDAPEITSAPVTSAATLVAYQYDVDAADADNDSLSYALAVAPPSMVIDAQSGLITWTPALEQVGTHPVGVRATDADGAQIQQNFIVNVLAGNRAPMIVSLAPRLGRVGETYTYDVDATDPDNDPLTYRLNSSPEGMTIDAQSGAITWSPTTSQIGANPVDVRVDDGVDGEGTQVFVIDVMVLNLAPTIGSTPPASVMERVGYVYDADAIDPNVGDLLGYSLTQKPAGMTIGASTGVIAWSPETRLVGGIETQNTQCRDPAAPPPQGGFQPRVKWSYRVAAGEVAHAPLVARIVDTNGDGQLSSADAPTVLVLSRGNLVAIHGVTGAVLWQSAGSYNSYGVTPAIGDVDADGRVEIFAYVNSQVEAVDDRGVRIWRSAAQVSATTRTENTGLTVADLDGDGRSEILAGDLVLNFDGSLKWRASNPARLSVPVVADLDLDGRPEVLIGGSAYRADGSVYWPTPVPRFDQYWSLWAVGNLDTDPYPELVVSAYLKLYVLEHDGAIKYGPIDFSGAYTLGSPTIADVDGDGQAEILVAGADFVNVLRADGTRLWRAVSRDASGLTGITAFDLDGDGRNEVLYAGDQELRIFDGPTGAVRFIHPNSSSTWIEYPVVADIDNNGHADILLANGYGVTALTDLADSWVPVRSIWNQHAYHIDNINDDATVPRIAANSWRTHNSFRRNALVDRSALGRVDLALFGLALIESESSAQLVVRARNRGLAPSAASSVRFYTDGDVLLGAVDLPSLSVGEMHEVSLELAAGAVIGAEISATIDESAVISECLENNNSVTATIVNVRATDSGGLFDAQRFSVVVENVNEAPSISTNALSNASIGVNYRETVYAADPDVGDGLRFALDAAPTGMTIEPVSGELRWLPGIAQAGNQTIVVRVTDLGGLSATRNYTLTLSSNRAPVITSVAPAEIAERAIYQYGIVAADPDLGDTLDFRIDQAPAGASLDSASGALAWSNSGFMSPSVRALNVVCRRPSELPVARPFQPVVKWSWGRRSTLSMPLVAPLRDSNLDGRFDQHDAPVVLVNSLDGFVDSATGQLIGLDGVTGAELWTQQITLGNRSALTRGSATPAIGDINGDGRPEIVAFTHDGGVVAFDNQGVPLWITAAPVVVYNTYNYGAISLYDLEGDGQVEILARNAVVNSDGSVRWKATVDPWNRNSGYAIDIDGDGVLEVVTGQYFFSASGTLLRTLPGDWVMTSPGNFDTDPAPEFAVVTTSASGPVNLSVIESDGAVVWTRTVADIWRGGPPVVSDLDGDGRPDISFIGMQKHVAYNTDGRLLWSYPTRDTSTGTNGSTSFDFDGDGSNEVVSQDEAKVRVFSGTTGAVLFSADFVSPTAAESPIVADVDADGHADILVEGSSSTGATLTVFRDIDNRWVGTRPLWNQYNYHIDNINDDLSVPRQPRKSWLTHNTFRLNAYPDRHSLGLADLALFDLHVDPTHPNTVNVYVINRGLAPTDAATEIEVFNGQPAGAQLLGTIEVPVLAVGESRVLALSELLDGAVTDDLYARVDHVGAIEECVENNNVTASAYFAVRASDGGGLFDTQRFTVSVTDINEAPSINTVALSNASVGVEYRMRVFASDPDLGDGLRFTLDVAPTGMTIEPVSGELRWLPGVAQAGNQTVLVRVTDLGGLSATRNYTLTLSGNRAPVITSTPVTVATVGLAYVYDVDATDPDGNPLSFSVLNAPVGMSIDALSGLIAWTPIVDQIGNANVLIQVTDNAGGVSAQAFTVAVAPTPINRAPEIVSLPVSSAVVGSAYAYAVEATDADGDILAYALAEAPAGMTIDAQTGVISWTPAANQFGDVEVVVLVTDDDGAAAIQSFTIAVNAPSNTLPVIHSSPLLNASATLAYGYDADATDADGDALTYALTTAPAGMTIDAQSGLVRWTPTGVQIGPHDVSLRVSDGRGGSMTQSFPLTVVAVPGTGMPQITSTPIFVGKVAQAYRYDVNATDSDGDTLLYSLTQSPAGMTIDAATGVIDWTPVAAGSFNVTVRAADAGGYASQSWAIAVITADIPLAAQVIVNPSVVVPGGAVRIVIQISGAGGATTVTATLAGMPIALDPDGDTTITAPSTPGCSAFVVTVSDGTDTVIRSVSLCVSDPNDGDDPVVELLAPLDNAEVSAPTAIVGTATDANFFSWALTAQPANSPQAAVTTLAEGTAAFTGQQLAMLDPTLMFNGLYNIVLQARDSNGRIASDSAVVRVTGDMKVGNFSISFEDVSIPVAGIPISVTRSYDTRQRSERLDFGYGWSVDYQNVRLRESGKAGFSWRNYRATPGAFGNWCTVSNGDRVVTITLPDGNIQSFKAKADPECTPLVPELNVRLTYVPIDGTDSTLEQTDYGQLRLITHGSTDLYDIVDLGDAGTVVDPNNYRLTTPEGVVYEIDQNFGLRRIIEPNGNSLTYSSTGVQHSSGVGVNFVRDAEGRISDIQLPDGEVLSYTYSAAGDLESFTDQADQTSTYDYGFVRFPHYLTDIFDPRGVRALRNEYNDDGRLTASIDADGRRIEYTHDIDGRSEQVRDRRGNVTTYLYDDNGWVLSETNALGETIARTYDADGNTLTETNALGHTVTRSYDVRGNALTERDAMAALTTSTYSNANNLLTEIDALGRAVASNSYDSSNSLLSTRDALGHSTDFGYDTAWQTGALTQMTDALNNVTRFEVNHRGWQTAQVDAAGHRTRYTHDANGRVLTETRSRTIDGAVEDLVTRYTYDAKGRMTRTEYPDGSATTTEYNAIDKPARSCDTANRCTGTTYDQRGNVSSVLYPDGRSETTEYDAGGNEVARVDRMGRSTRMVYDAANRLIETIYPDQTPGSDADNPRTQSDYDAAGQLTASINERGQRTQYRYDAAGRQIEMIDALGRSMTTAYDLTGRRLSSTDALGRTVKYRYDLAGKLLETMYPDAVSEDADDSNNPRTTMEYDAAGRKTAEFDEMDRKTTFAYDALGRLTDVTLGAATATPFTTTYAYDEQGNKVAQTDAEGRVTAWGYDGNGRNVSRTLPLGQSELFSYNPAGERVLHSTFNGEEMSYAYDELGRIDTITFPDGATRVFTYNTSGEISAINDKGSIYQFGYDERDRLDSATDAQGRRIDYGYDASGNRTQLTTPGMSVAYSYDALNRLSEVVANLAGQPADQRAVYRYDAVGNREGLTQANGSTVTYQYDRRNRLKHLAHRTAAGVLMLGLAYGVDASGLRTAIEESQGSSITRSTGYQYDALKRLTNSQVIGSSAALSLDETFSYDKVGNRLSRTCVGQLRTCSSGRDSSTSIGSVATTNLYDANDRLTRESDIFGAYDYSFDDAGNLLRKTENASILAAYRWDAENRLVEATLTPTGASGTRTVTRYQYDASGIRRMSEVVAQSAGMGAATTKTRTQFLVDPNQAYAQVLEDWTATATQPGTTEPTLPDVSLQNSYIFGDDLIAEARYSPLPSGQVGANTPGEGGNDPLARIGTSTGNSALHYDGLGTTRLLSTINVDTTGAPLAGNEAITDQYAYTAFGESDLASTTGNTDNNYRYTGEQLDPNLGFYYLRSRLMNPAHGRFITLDSYMGNQHNPISLHKYVYADANPVMYSDPSGQMSLGETTTAQHVQNNVRTSMPTASKNALNIARRAKLFDVYSYVTPWPLHFFMYVERIGTFQGTRYDVGAAGDWGNLLGEVCRLNICGRMPGGYVKPSPEARANLRGIKKKVASFSYGQHLFWHWSVMGTEQLSCTVSLNYSLIPGPNCMTWTVDASIAAWTISKMKI